MVEKKLNFNQPILSVRRHSSMMHLREVDEGKIENALPVLHRLPPYRSELKSGPVRNPAAVPFQWELTPGQPKEQIKPVSRMDDLDANNSSSSSTDPQTQDAKVDRFLPASMGTESEELHCAPKKQSAVQEQPQQLKREIVNQDKPALQHEPSFANIYSHYDTKEKEESDDDHGQHENLLRVCCLLPRSCLKSSVCILNPVPAMSVSTRVTIFAANRTQSGSSSADSSTDTENECKVKPVDKIQKAELKENKMSLKNEIGQLESHNALMYHGKSPPFLEEKETIGIAQDTKHDCLESFGPHKKTFKTLQELLADQDSPKKSDSRNYVEKTVYVDTEEKVDNMRSCSFNTKDTGVPGSREDNSEITTKGTYQIHILDSSLEDFKKLNTVDRQAKLLSTDQKAGDFNFPSSTDKTDIKWGTIIPKSFGGNEDPYLDSTSIETIQVAEKKAAKNAGKQLPRAKTIRNSHEKYSKFPLPPPLPRSPSDSWLFRTLPSMSRKKASLHSYLGAARNPQKGGSNFKGS